MEYERRRQKDTSAAAAQLDYEILQEQAAALGRLGRALEQALAALRQFDERRGQSGEALDAAAARAALVDAAGHALWLFVVQREACGLRDMRQVIRDYHVPAAVQYRMGVFPPKAATPGT
jgi:hypothetical protein